MLNLFENFNTINHYYTLATIGLKKEIMKTFPTRQEANAYMFKLIEKYSLHIEKTYNDNHDKTYCCNNNVKFYIQRF